MIAVFNTFVAKGMKEDDVFCDIGSGIGNFVFTSAIYFNRRALGIEIVQNRHNAAAKFLNEEKEKCLQ